jgi:signal transduction histidine kinase
MGIHLLRSSVAGGVTALMVGLFIIVALHTRLDEALQALSIGPLFLELLSLSGWSPFEVFGLSTLLTADGNGLTSHTGDIPPWVALATRLLSMALIAVPVWFFMDHVERDRELKELNEGLQARTRELAAVNESLVTEVLERKQTEQSLEASREDLRKLASQLLSVQEEERQRISRDLHDDINQRLALLAVDIEALEQQLSTAPIGTVRAVRSIQDRIVELSDDVRHLAHQLHPSMLDDLGLSVALQRLLDDFTARTEVRGAFIDHDSPKLLAQDVATCLYRVAQESLRNVSRHAKAKQVRIELARIRNGLQLMVGDDGVGFDTNHPQDKQGGLGLLSMRERVALVDGTLDIQSVDGEGTRVRVWVPLGK